MLFSSEETNCNNQISIELRKFILQNDELKTQYLNIDLKGINNFAPMHLKELVTLHTAVLQTRTGNDEMTFENKGQRL